MTDAQHWRSGKTHRDENFPVASRLIHARHRALILAFYEFVRTADDIADHATLTAQQKVELLDRLEADLTGAGDGNPQAVTLRHALAERGLSPRHAQDLLKAFRLDATKLRYADWDDLIGYCRYSAMPVGRFVLDVHGEDRAIWPSNDALCAALQIINHLQDCGKDYRALDRVYVPLDALAAQETGVEALAATRASPALRQVIEALARRTGGLLAQSRPFASGIADRRLALEVGVIQALAESLVKRLQGRDPLSQRVHHRPAEAVGLALYGAAGVAVGWLGLMGRHKQPRLRGGPG